MLLKLLYAFGQSLLFFWTSLFTFKILFIYLGHTTWLEDLNSPTRDRTRAPALEVQSPKYTGPSWKSQVCSLLSLLFRERICWAPYLAILEVLLLKSYKLYKLITKLILLLGGEGGTFLGMWKLQGNVILARCWLQAWNLTGAAGVSPTL